MDRHLVGGWDQCSPVMEERVLVSVTGGVDDMVSEAKCILSSVHDKEGGDTWT